MIPESRRATWTNDEFIDGEVYPTDSNLSRDLHNRWQRRKRTEAFEQAEYRRLLSKTGSEKVATAAFKVIYNSMPPAGYKKKKPDWAGKPKGVSSVAKAAKYTKANYGVSKVDEKAMMRLAKQMAEREVNKNIETQYSMAMVRMIADDAVLASTGWALKGLNYRAAEAGQPRKLALNNALIFNLGYLSQVGSSTLPGYRQGQRINAKALSFTITGTLPQVTADCTYHWRVVRRKNDVAGNLAYAQPEITTMDVIGLYKSATDGPLASSIAYNGENGGSPTAPIPGHVSAMRQNTDQWTFLKDAHGSYTVKASPLDPGVSDQKRVVDFCEKLRVSVEAEWDFVSRTGCDIKGGNYFFIMWREGAQDHVAASQFDKTAATNDNPMLSEQISVWMELSFKDG